MKVYWARIKYVNECAQVYGVYVTTMLRLRVSSFSFLAPASISTRAVLTPSRNVGEVPKQLGVDGIPRLGGAAVSGIKFALR